MIGKGGKLTPATKQRIEMDVISHHARAHTHTHTNKQALMHSAKLNLENHLFQHSFVMHSKSVK